MATLALAMGVVLAIVPVGASADPNDPSQVRTMVCDNGRTVEAVIHHSNTKTLHVTTTTENFVIKFIEREGVVLVQTPGFDDVPMVTCETVEFDLTVRGFFTPRGD